VLRHLVPSVTSAYVGLPRIEAMSLRFTAIERLPRRYGVVRSNRKWRPSTWMSHVSSRARFRSIRTTAVSSPMSTSRSLFPETGRIFLIRSIRLNSPVSPTVFPVLLNAAVLLGSQ
jgi:hypothetical protein